MEEIENKNFIKQLGEEGIKEFLEDVLNFQCKKVFLFDERGGLAIAQYIHKENSAERDLEEYMQRKIAEKTHSVLNEYEHFQYYVYLTNFIAQDVTKNKSYTNKYTEFMKSKFGERYVIENEKHLAKLKEDLDL